MRDTFLWRLCQKECAWIDCDTKHEWISNMKQLFESWSRFLKEDKGPSRDEQLQAFLEDDPSVMDNWARAIEFDDDFYEDEVLSSLEDWFIPPAPDQGKEETVKQMRVFIGRKMRELIDKARQEEMTPEESMKELYTEITYIKGLLRKHGSEGGVDAY